MNEVQARQAYSFLVAATARAPEKVLLSRWARIEAEGIEDLLWLAGSLAVTPVLGRFIQAHSSRLQPPVMRRLTAAALMARSRGAISLALLQRIAAQDCMSDSENIVIKGGGLTLAGLTDRDRYFVDIDVVIDRETLDRWREAASLCGASWQSGAPGGYEVAYISADHSLIELHVALPGRAGSEHGPSYDALRKHARAVSPRILVPSAAVSREVAVQHFVAHHNGEPGHALRTIQDLVALESEGEGDGLNWDDEEIGAAVTRFRRIARAATAGNEEEDEEAAPFFDGLFRLVLTERPAAEASFTDAVDHWLETTSMSGRSRFVLLVGRIFPPPAQMRRSEDEHAAITAGRYVSRPAHLFGRYIRGAVQRMVFRRHTREIRRWRALISGRKTRRR